jgi:hypothetical protein
LRYALATFLVLILISFAKSSLETAVSFQCDFTFPLSSEALKLSFFHNSHFSAVFFNVQWKYSGLSQ